MQLEKNIVNGELNAVDTVSLTLANCTATQFPEASVYVGCRQQAMVPPALYIRVSAIEKQRRLIYTAAYEVTFQIDYYPIEAMSDTEKNTALLLLQEKLTAIPGLPVQAASSRESGDYASITGLVQWFTQLDQVGETIHETSETVYLKTGSVKLK